MLTAILKEKSLPFCLLRITIENFVLNNSSLYELFSLLPNLLPQGYNIRKERAEAG